MKYMGSKARHSAEILSVVLKDRKPGQVYVEPFVGGGNVIDKVSGLRLGADSNQYVIAMFQALQRGWEPPSYVSQILYNSIRENKESFDPWFVGFVGVGCSYSGKWFGGYAQGGFNGKIPRNHCLESRKSLLSQLPNLKEVVFVHSNYQELTLPTQSLIYCDPPYDDTTAYGKKFDSKTFWRWCNKQTEEGHNVFVSEYKAPDDWECVWEKKVNSSLTKETGSKTATERLFKKKNV